MPLGNIDEVLLSAEREIALLDRCRPLNVRVERARVLGEWQRAQPASPQFEYARVPCFGGLRRRLVEIAEQLAQVSEVGSLYAARALELELEGRMAEAVGRKELCELGRQRFSATPEDLQSAAECAARFEVSGHSSETASSTLHRSDDARDPLSLLSQLRRTVDVMRLPICIESSPNLASVAATTNAGQILVRAGVTISEPEVRRIVVHEVLGHALPRIRARATRLGLFRVGTARGSDDEEGRALVLEQRTGSLSAERRAALALRHRAALAVRAGASFVEVTRELVSRGATLEAGIDVAFRAYRGGGLAREIVYLTAFSRVQRAFEAEPELEPWLERGRLSIAAARVLRELGEPPEYFDTEAAA